MYKLIGDISLMTSGVFYFYVICDACWDQIKV
jgi:hypothetical protein